MTENMAGRGEGLAGLVARERAWAKTLRGSACNTEAREIERICDELAALEAAAPAGTAQSQQEFTHDLFAAIHRTNYPGCGDCENFPTTRDVGMFDAIHKVLKRYALATPSLQAPQQESAFSTTSAREQSSATASIPLRHGVNCEKKLHVRDGYLHGEEDDTPYDVDGVKYCGRCHIWLDAVPAATLEPAGSGATSLQATKDETRGDVCEGNAPRLLAESPSNFALTVGNVTGVLFNAGVGLTAPVAAKVTAELNAIVGSSRKVGEEEPEQPFFFAIETAGGDWHDGEYCVFGSRVEAQDRVDDLNEELPEAEWFRVVPLYRVPSSAPVGEQKQEEGV